MKKPACWPVHQRNSVSSGDIQGAPKRVLLPLSNRRQFVEIPPDTIEKVDMIFYSEPFTAALKALGMD